MPPGNPSMPEIPEAHRLMEQQALELRARAERFRTFAEGNRTTMRQTLIDLARDSDAFAARIEAQLRALGAGDNPPSSPAVDPSAADPRSTS